MKGLYSSESGERNFSSSEGGWRARLNSTKTNSVATDYAGQDIEDHYFYENEVGLKHPITQSVVKLTDEGFIDMFADEQVGIRIDPESKSVNILAENINFLGKNINMKTQPNGLIWNDYYFNPQLYYEDEKERAQVITGHKEYYHYTHEEEPKLRWHRDPWEIQPMVRSNTRFRYSSGVQEIMKDLGIPVSEQE